MTRPGDCTRPHLLFLVPEDSYFWSHRLDLARTASDAGFEVSVAAGVREHAERIEGEGFGLHPLTFHRGKANPFLEARSLWRISRLYRKVRPDLVHHVGLRPILHGTLAAWQAGVPAIVNAFAGLGYAFTGKGAYAAAARGALRLLPAGALAPSRCRAIFQNPEDAEELAQRGIVPRGISRVVRGSGVDVDLFRPSPEREGEVQVLLPTRLLRSKGVGEFVEAASRLKARGVRARFVIVGRTDPDSPDSLTPATVEGWCREGTVEWQGHLDDMPSALRDSHVVVLPTYYGEGLPKCLLEGAAAGRALVATDIRGCREIVRHGQNGLLVPPRDAGALAEAIGHLVANPEARRQMGLRGRAIVEEEFSVRKISLETMGIYRELLGEARPGKGA